MNLVNATPNSIYTWTTVSLTGKSQNKFDARIKI